MCKRRVSRTLLVVCRAGLPGLRGWDLHPFWGVQCVCFLHCRDVLNRNWRNVLLHGPGYSGCDLLWNLHRLHRWKILVDCGCRLVRNVLVLLGGNLRFGGYLCHTVSELCGREILCFCWVLYLHQLSGRVFWCFNWQLIHRPMHELCGRKVFRP